jgi:ABC-2 type transport system permease protein
MNKTNKVALDFNSKISLDQLRRSIFHNLLNDLKKNNRLRLAIAIFCCTIFWLGMFVLFLGGFEFVESFRLTNEIYEYLFGIFFFTLFVMLFFSNGIIIYAGLFHSRETNWLMTQPLAEDRIFVHKFIESFVFASWGVVLLGSPVLVAYGLSIKAHLAFFISIMPLLIAFVGIPAGLGSCAAILIAWLLPRRPKTILLTIITLIVMAIVLLIWRLVMTPGTTLTADWMDAFLNRLQFSRHPLLPSRWMSYAVVKLAAGDHWAGLLYLVVTLTNAAMAFLVSAWAASRLFRPAFYKAQGERSARIRRSSNTIDRMMHRLFWFIHQPVRLLMIKDARCFLRDPAQWSQFIIFFGLLAAYFWNIRKFSTNLDNLVWRNLISFLNLSVTALLLATFTSRFIFPMMSLEGRNAWMLNLLPVRRSQILWGKFAFSFSLALFASELLLIISDLQLGVHPVIVLSHIVLMAVICAGLSAISVGLGAKMPNYRETDPSKIAAGFGGTLNLVVSLLFLLITIAAVSLPCHLYFISIQSAEGFRKISLNWSLERFQLWLGLAVGFSALVGLLAVIIPIRIGLKQLANQEF